MSEFSVAMTESLNAELRSHLERSDGQEDLCFATWTPLTGRDRETAILTSIIRPTDGEREVHGNASFAPVYLLRALSTAARLGEGLAFLHSHPQSKGWQAMSPDDVVAEQRIAPAAMAVTGKNLVGLTSSSNAGWSARQWRQRHGRFYEPQDAVNVRVVGSTFQVSFPPRSVQANRALERSTSVWGDEGQDRLARLRIGIVGLGSVGSIVCEALCRAGIENLALVDFDCVEHRNLDRLLFAQATDIGDLKVAVAATRARAVATAADFQIATFPERCDEHDAMRALLDCDVIFSCVDRPWPRRVLNQLSMAALIPIVNSGILVSKRRDRLTGADWHVQTSGPERRCLQCWGTYDPGDAAMEFAGLLDDPNYVKQLDPQSPLLSHANVIPFALSTASFAVLQLMALVNSPVPNHGDQNYHFITGTLDRSPDTGCKPQCPFPGYVGSGDRQLPAIRTYESTNLSKRLLV